MGKERKIAQLKNNENHRTSIDSKSNLEVDEALNKDFHIQEEIVLKQFINATPKDLDNSLNQSKFQNLTISTDNQATHAQRMQSDQLKHMSVTNSYFVDGKVPNGADDSSLSKSDNENTVKLSDNRRNRNRVMLENMGSTQKRISKMATLRIKDDPLGVNKSFTVKGHQGSNIREEINFTPDNSDLSTIVRRKPQKIAVHCKRHKKYSSTPTRALTTQMNTHTHPVVWNLF